MNDSDLVPSAVLSVGALHALPCSALCKSLTERDDACPGAGIQDCLQWITACFRIIARGEKCIISGRRNPGVQIYLCKLQRGDCKLFLTKRMRCVQ